MSDLVEVRATLAQSGDLEIVIAESDCDVAEIVDRLRASGAGIALLLIDSSVPALDRALLSAAIGPLAIERAPHARIGAVDVADGAATADVAAAANYLLSARSTTGQILRITATG
ncbi:MAG: Rossmann fold domain-containing protein [Sphingomonas sp.]